VTVTQNTQKHCVYKCDVLNGKADGTDCYYCSLKV